MNCKVCHNSYRKGVIVYVANGSSLVRARVCQKCAGNSIPILPQEQGTFCSCGSPANMCSKCSEKKEHKAKTSDVRSAIDGIRKLVKSYTVVAPLAGAEDYTQGKVEGLEAAACFLESGHW